MPSQLVMCCLLMATENTDRAMQSSNKCTLESSMLVESVLKIPFLIKVNKNPSIST